MPEDPRVREANGQSAVSSTFFGNTPSLGIRARVADRATDLSKVCFDAACSPVTLLQANPDVGLEPRHEFDPPTVVSHVRMVQCAEVPYRLGCINTSSAANRTVSR